MLYHVGMSDKPRAAVSEVARAAASEEARRLLRAHGLHVTAPRVVVLEVLREAHGHLSADDVYAAVLARYPAINIVTIYRTLESFERHGLAVRGTLGDKVTRWEHVDEAHHHLVCQRCGEIVELGDASFQRLADDLNRRYGVRLSLRHLSLKGLCAECAVDQEGTT